MNEREFKQKHSSGSFTFTRVTSARKQARKTVGITINPQILEQARNRNLNISRICEQALSSILEYYPQATETESSISFPRRGSFPKESWAGRLARLESTFMAKSPANPFFLHSLRQVCCLGLQPFDARALYSTVPMFFKASRTRNVSVSRSFLPQLPSSFCLLMTDGSAMSSCFFARVLLALDKAW